MTKILKPGQLCTIYGKCYDSITQTTRKTNRHVYRCKKAIMGIGTCSECVKVNRCFCILSYNNVLPAMSVCRRMFGAKKYPVLVK